MSQQPLNPEIIRAFQEDRGWNDGEMCEQLGVSRGKLKRLKSGQIEAGRTIALALAALALKIPPYQG